MFNLLKFLKMEAVCLPEISVKPRRYNPEYEHPLVFINPL